MRKAILILAIIAVFASWVTYKIVTLETPKIPKLDLEEWWGPGTKKDVDKSIRPFKISWSKEMIEDLKHRLSKTRPLTPPLEGIAFEYGTNTKALVPILDYWQNNYNFNERLDYLNKFPQFKTNIQGLDIHFIWVKPKQPSAVKVVPLLLLHGWPGSVREFYEAIPLLTRQRPGYNFVFEVVVPSLAGFGYSDPAVRPGLGSVEMAVVMRNLMRRLGHEEFYIQGGDWGSVISSAMATVFPDEILGFHTNMPYNMDSKYLLKVILGSFLPWYVEPAFAQRLYPLSKLLSEFLKETGYYHIQATKPDTIGVAVKDSPAGLAAYILEKFSTGTNLEYISKEDGGLSDFKMEDLIDNLMIYWDSGSITTSFRLYAEKNSERARQHNIQQIPTPVPVWALHTAHEPIINPATLLRHKFTNILDVSLIDEGGHFAAFEVPKLFAEDVFQGVRAFELFHKNNESKKK